MVSITSWPSSPASIFRVPSGSLKKAFPTSTRAPLTSSHSAPQKPLSSCLAPWLSGFAGVPSQTSSRNWHWLSLAHCWRACLLRKHMGGGSQVFQVMALLGGAAGVLVCGVPVDCGVRVGSCASAGCSCARASTKTSTCHNAVGRLRWAVCVKRIGCLLLGGPGRRCHRRRLLRRSLRRHLAPVLSRPVGRQVGKHETSLCNANDGKLPVLPAQSR